MTTAQVWQITESDSYILCKNLNWSNHFGLKACFCFPKCCKGKIIFLGWFGLLGIDWHPSFPCEVCCSMDCSMLFFSKPADTGFFYTENGSEAAGVSLVSGTWSKLSSFFAVVFEK